jgi:hypothetical protein
MGRDHAPFQLLTLASAGGMVAFASRAAETWDGTVTAAVVRDCGVIAGQMDDRVEVRLPRS